MFFTFIQTLYVKRIIYNQRKLLKEIYKVYTVMYRGGAEVARRAHNPKDE
jgi:hypothetical protein